MHKVWFSWIWQYSSVSTRKSVNWQAINEIARKIGNRNKTSFMVFDLLCKNWSFRWTVCPGLKQRTAVRKWAGRSRKSQQSWKLSTRNVTNNCQVDKNLSSNKKTVMLKLYIILQCLKNQNFKGWKKWMVACEEKFFIKIKKREVQKKMMTFWFEVALG